ncbi:MAG: type 4a pilus biogenesis protein PilO [Candidatus Sumerlaea chitinivorans]|nr:type 4a pilus biogenesis protein PilO [Candidatus Sumerlaea chitinivorans]
MMNVWAALTPQEKDLAKAGAVLAVLIFAGVAYYNWFFMADKISRNQKQIEVVQKEIKELDSKIRDLQAALGNPEELKAKQEFLKKIAAKLPDSPDAPGFFQALSKVLQVTRVDYTELEPLKEVSRSAYVEIPYRIKGTARYHDFGHFLNLIEDNPDRFMRVRTFTIENRDDRPSVHPVTIELATFMFVKRG